MGALNRRALFGAVPVIATAGLATSASAADTNLADLGRRWEIACKEAERLGDQIDRVFEVFTAGMPATPGLFFTAEDRARGLYGVTGTPIPWDRVKLVAKQAKEGWGGTGPYPLRDAWSKRFEDAVAQHQAAVDAWDRQCCYTALNDAWDAKQEEICGLEREIISTPCRSIDDARVHARVAVKNPDNDFGKEAGLVVAEFVLRMGAH